MRYLFEYRALQQYSMAIQQQYGNARSFLRCMPILLSCFLVEVEAMTCLHTHIPQITTFAAKRVTLARTITRNSQACPVGQGGKTKATTRRRGQS